MMKKTLRLAFEEFFTSPTKEKFRDLVSNNLGEFNYVDYKSEWPERSKLAKHMLAMANSGGGAIVTGVVESSDGLDPTGVSAVADKTDLHNGIKKFMPSDFSYEIADFSYTDEDGAGLAGKRFQVMFVDSPNESLPFICADSGKNAREAAIYVRRGSASAEANYEELQRILNTRVETRYSSSRSMSLKDHLAELSLLYRQIDRYISIEDHPMSLGEYGVTGNPEFPQESFEEFVGRLIKSKKKRIELVLESERKR